MVLQAAAGSVTLPQVAPGPAALRLDSNHLRGNISLPRRLLPGDLGDIWSALPDYSAVGGQLLMGGNPIKIKGVSWFGAEGQGRAPDGLWNHDVDYYLAFLVRSGFNAVRLPFALDNVLSNQGPKRDMLQKSPTLWNLGYLEVLERTVDAAAERGLLVLLDLHRLNSARWPDDGLWYAPGVTIETVKAAWDKVQARFCDRWNVMGADLLNEPHGAKWADWARTASELGDFVLSKCARWLIFVEGVAHEGDTKRAEYFWGENMEGADQTPVTLATPNKLVYSPHVYGPGDGAPAHHMPYFDDKDFPSNMEAIWQRHFGYLATSGATVVVGEWGGTFNGDDKKWQEAFLRFLSKHALSSFYWALNPNSADTGGLLKSDWAQPESAKLSLLGSVPSTKLLPLLSGSPAFRCPAGALRPNHFRCADGSGCILKQQACNGYHECADDSDELACQDVERPCLTRAGGSRNRPCLFPFTYNGFRYDRCTLVDAVDAWVRVGVGLCQHGYIAALAKSGVSLSACTASCTRASHCEFVSYESNSGGFCGGYTAACATEPLNAAKAAYTTYRVNEGGGAWCPTSLRQGGEYVDADSAGVCGPACPLPEPGDREANDPARSRCGDGGVHSDHRGSAHCGPSPPPPPGAPPPPPPPPTLPPPGAPPALPPPPSPWYEPASMARNPLALGGLGLLGSVLLCLLWAAVRQKQLAAAARRPDFRHLTLDELQMLSDDGAEMSQPSRARRAGAGSGRRGGAAGGRPGGGGRLITRGGSRAMRTAR